MTHLRAGAVDVRDVDWTRPTAIVLGNEKQGPHRLLVEAMSMQSVPHARNSLAAHLRACSVAVQLPLMLSRISLFEGFPSLAVTSPGATGMPQASSLLLQ